MNDEKQYQLFCLPYSGGKSTVFKDISKLISKDIELHCIEYPGRCTRAKEAYIQDYEDFIIDLKKQIAIYRKLDLPYGIFGYSIGALFDYDLVARGLIDGG